jgi:hypothetical protein
MESGAHYHAAENRDAVSYPRQFVERAREFFRSVVMVKLRANLTTALNATPGSGCQTKTRGVIESWGLVAEHY